MRTELPASTGGQPPCLNAGAAALVWPDETADWWLDETAETTAFPWAAFTELPASTGEQSPGLRTGSLTLAAAPFASLFAARAEATAVIGEAAAIVVTNEAATVVVAVVDRALMAIRVVSRSWDGERAGSAKSKHSPPASNQHPLKIAEVQL